MKEERIEIRTELQIKNMIQKAADIVGTSLSSFFIQNTLRAARKIVAKNEAIILNEQEWNRFMSLLDNPPEPNEALKNLFKKFN